MYSTCIHCHTKLGANEAIEHFPVGRRLAFDAARGRLWVVCCACSRWNLTPLEERWEAIEQCERFFRDTKLRVSTENIGLARLREGVELVRIGAPQRPEMAAWRYGEQFRRRQRRSIAVGIAVGAVFPTIMNHTLVPTLMGSLPLLLGFASCAGLGAIPPLTIRVQRLRRVVGRGAEHSALPWTLRGRNVQMAKFVAASETKQGWRLHVAHNHGESLLEGAEALRMLRPMLAWINREGAVRAGVQGAVARLEAEGGSEQIFARTAQRGIIRHEHGALRLVSQIDTIGKLPQSLRLALEMATHEETERQALEGELAALEREWQDAEEIAAIADNLLIPAAARDFLVRHRRAAEVDPA